jgi:arylsulfatase A-like enzyme
MKKITIVILGLLLNLGCRQKQKEEISTIPSQPNIVLFLVDDMGWEDTSVSFWDKRTPFNERYHTPNMERLAAQGVKFTQAYATTVCTPSRVSLMTGMNAARHRVTNWTLMKDQIQPMELNHPTLQFPEWNVNGMSPVAGIEKSAYATPLPEILHEAGYFTIHCGKAHFGAKDTPASNPINLGFDVNIAGHAAGAPASYFGTQDFGNGMPGKELFAVPGLEEYYGKDIFLTEVLTLEAKKAMDRAVNKKQPFFLYMAHYAVHTPIKGDGRFLQKYYDMGLDTIEANYSSMVEGVDRSLGVIMDYLESRKIDDNTILLFMSDNGGLSAHGRGGVLNIHNRPLASGKGSAYEGGIRVPMIVKWPGITKPDTQTDQKVIIEDFFPTVLEMTNIQNKKSVQKVDGQSFVSILKGLKRKDDRPLFWHYPNEWGVSGPGIGASSTVRLGDWKLIYFHANQHLELYNIKDDIAEQHDLVKTEPEKSIKLARVLSDYLREVKAQMPLDKVTRKLVPYPDVVIDGSGSKVD